jgi:hypothetical protein
MWIYQPLVFGEKDIATDSLEFLTAGFRVPETDKDEPILRKQEIKVQNKGLGV